MSKETEAIQLDDSERQRCEIWTRVMGYHRPIENYNIGKKGEHEERTHFKEEKVCEYLDGCGCGCK